MCTKMVSKTFVFKIIYLSAYLCICSSHKDTSRFGHDRKAHQEERNRERRAAPDISIGNNTCIPIIYNQETYYTVETKPNLVDQYWVEIPDSERQTIKPNTKTNHQKLSFGFPLFGHTVHTIFPTVNGFISTRGSSPEEYVAPFFTDRNISYPIISHNTERFVVEWNGKSEFSANEKLQIQTIGYRNGTIMFLYKRLSDVYRNTNVTIGIDNNVWVLMEGVTAIVAYKEIDVDLDTIAEGTVLIFTPVGECDLTRNARKCDTLMATFYCEVCHVIKHCDWEVHRHVSHWMDTSCTIQVPSFCKQTKPSSMISTIFIVVVSGIGFIILSILAVWFYYAYTRPTTPSGRWLIEHRPSQWKNLFIRRKEESGTEGNNPSLTMEEDR